MDNGNGGIEVPHVQIKGGAAADIVRYVIARWKAVRPEEAAAWPAHCMEQRKRQKRGGWGDDKHIKLAFLIPPYVMHVCGRIFQDPDWMRHDESALNAYLSEMPCARMDGVIGTPGHSAITSGDKDLTR